MKYLKPLKRPRRGVRPDLLFVLIVVAVWLVYTGVWALVRDQVTPKNLGVVVPDLVYRSGQISPRMIEPTLRRLGIKVVIVLFQHVATRETHVAEVKACEKLGIEVVRIPMGGRGTDPMEKYAEAIERIHRAVEEGTPLLIHCSAGAQRTGGIIAAYRLLVLRENPDRVYQLMRERGWDPRSNPHLVRHVNRHMRDLARRLVRRRVIRRPPRPLPKLQPPR